MHTHQALGIAIIVPRLPPSIDGVGDYTFQLLVNSQWLKNCLILVSDYSQRSQQCLLEHRVERLPNSRHEFFQILRNHNVTTIVVQYSAYGFNGRGFPYYLLKNLRLWRTANNKRRLIVMAHELWHESPPCKLSFYFQLAHKIVLKQTLKISDCVFTSTNGYYSILCKFVRQPKVRFLPVASNITPVYDSSQHKKQKNSWVVFGRQRNRISTLEAFKDLIPKLYANGALEFLHIIGANGCDADQIYEQKLLESFLPKDHFVRHGFLESDQISFHLSKIQFGLFAESYLSCEKSTVFMAFASHQVSIIVPSCWPEGFPLSALVSDSEFLLSQRSSTFADIPGSTLLFKWYQANCSWMAISGAYCLAINDFQGSKSGSDTCK
jgi:hypothetical protein